jgi:glycosyltransferase involved in cell wall biosynthesis
MKLSIVTINYNNADGLKKTLKSVEVLLSDLSIEHIIIDGGSVDGSLFEIENYSRVNPRVICKSEADSGIYNAMNKGIALARGEYVAFLNSGDCLSANMTSKGISEIFGEYSGADGIYGNVRFRKSMGRVSRIWVSAQARRWRFLYGWMPPHPMLLVRKELFESYGTFDEKFKIAADYDLIIRFFFKHRCSLEFANRTFVDMEDGGISNGSLRQVMKANTEVLASWSKYFFPFVPIWIFICKPLSKIRPLV